MSASKPSPDEIRELAETVRKEGFGVLADYLEDGADELDEDDDA